jgi:two-component system chemotaxis response regulator CheB
MFSSLTYDGARITLDALEAGAVDFLSKQFDAIAASEAALLQILTDRICEVAKTGEKKPKARVSTSLKKSASQPVNKASTNTNISSSKNSKIPSVTKSLHHVDVVIIGTSTGGPAALQTIFKNIPAEFKKPIIIVQHMPGTFTKAFAERLNRLSPLTVREAAQGDKLEPGHVYVAPGGMQLMIDKRNGGSIHIHESDDRISYRPSVDIALASAAKHFGRKALAVVLTGMGSDGKEGAKLLKQAGGTVWAQDEASCVIFGMPMAIIKAGLAAKILPLNDIGPHIFNEAG